MSEAHKLPCERCGLPVTSQYCVDCRRVDPDMCAGGRNTADQQKWINARRRLERQDEFWSWVRSIAPTTAAAGKAKQRQRAARKAKESNTTVV